MSTDTNLQNGIAGLTVEGVWRVSTVNADIHDAAQAVFGTLAERAAGHLKAYWSDLYHDVRWLDENLRGEHLGFWYAYDENGTHIGTDAMICRFRKNAVFVTVSVDSERGYDKKIEISLATVDRPDGWKV